MPEVTDQPVKPPRLWRPMVGCTLGIVAALGLAWFIGAVVVPVWRVHSALARLDTCPDSVAWRQAVGPEIANLGGKSSAACRIGLYLQLPRAIASHRKDAASVLGHCDSAGLPPLLSMLDDTDELLSVLACESIGRLGDRNATPFLVKALGSQNLLLRRTAVSALGTLKDPRAVRPLIAVLGKRSTVHGSQVSADSNHDGRQDRSVQSGELAVSENDVRAMAAWALGHIGKRSAYGPLLSTMQDDNETVEVRCLAAVGLGLLNVSAAGEHLLKVMDGDNEDLARSAAVGLYHMRYRAAIPRIKAALRSDDKHMRAVAAFCLGELDAQDAVLALEHALSDPYSLVRDNARQALQQIRGEESPK